MNTKTTKVTTPAGLHNRNKHSGRYDFTQLVRSLPEIEKYIIKNLHGSNTIDFSDPIAVKLLNKGLLIAHYNVTYWDVPVGYLCPPIPGRADYVHRLADLLEEDNAGLKHHTVKALDIGVGANCIYPIIGVTDYGWSFVTSDVDPVSVKSAAMIAKNNTSLNGRIECRLQTDSRHYFENVINDDEYYDITMCNPPFHKSLQDALSGTERKLENLKANRAKKGISGRTNVKGSKTVLNFGGQKAELWCAGGEAEFIKNMAIESEHYADQVLWFSTLISKKDNVRWMRKNLEKVGAVEVRIVEMSQGQKISRFVAWSFKDQPLRKKWMKQKR